MNKSVARGIALALLSATSFHAAADAHLIRVALTPGRIKNNLRKASRPIY
ncbi:methionine ABC transporter substrate-binding protein [Klebsiella pneumoniae]|nr:methionine ABC transporter substrate-binding protein [Klebsiella pneumoniae]